MHLLVDFCWKNMFFAVNRRAAVSKYLLGLFNRRHHIIYMLPFHKNASLSAKEL